MRAPVKVLLPESVMVPAPLLVNDIAPDMTEETVLARELVMLNAAPELTLPVTLTTPPVRETAAVRHVLFAPLTVMVPVPALAVKLAGIYQEPESPNETLRLIAPLAALVFKDRLLPSLPTLPISPVSVIAVAVIVLEAALRSIPW